MRHVIMLLVACTAAACANQPFDTGVSPTSTLSMPSNGLAAIAPIGNPDNSCPDQVASWVTPHYSTDDGYIKGEWTPVHNVETYQVEISYSVDGSQPWRVVSMFDTNRTEFRYVDAEHGGRYLVRVRVKNRCDRSGAWSEQLSIIIGGGADPTNDYEQECEECYYTYDR
jgi:hypothetical protein